ncbi:MAG: hypothetical protein EOM62_09895 [Bacteroidia bacterium]|nr:hypothetical protein [Bacteroidia bacterium]
MKQFDPKTVIFAEEHLQRAFEDLFTAKMLRVGSSVGEPPKSLRFLSEKFSEPSMDISRDNVETIPFLDFGNVHGDGGTKKDIIEKHHHSGKGEISREKAVSLASISVPRGIFFNNDKENLKARQVLFALGMCAAAENDLITLKAINDWEGIDNRRKNILAKKRLLHTHQALEKFAKALYILLAPQPTDGGGMYFPKIHDIETILTKCRFPKGSCWSGEDTLLSPGQRDVMWDISEIASRVKYPDGVNINKKSLYNSSEFSFSFLKKTKQKYGVFSQRCVAPSPIF